MENDIALAHHVLHVHKCGRAPVRICRIKIMLILQFWCRVSTLWVTWIWTSWGRTCYSQRVSHHPFLRIWQTMLQMHTQKCELVNRKLLRTRRCAYRQISLYILKRCTALNRAIQQQGLFCQFCGCQQLSHDLAGQTRLVNFEISCIYFLCACVGDRAGHKRGTAPHENVEGECVFVSRPIS